MAAIGSIRKRSGLLIIIIGVALVLFLLTDFLGKANFGGPTGETNVGSIKGEPISQQDFATRVETALQAQSQGQAITEAQRTQVRSRVWEQILRERILETEYSKLGINVTPEELYDQITNAQPGSLIYQYFSDQQTGQVMDQFRDPNTGLLDGNKVIQTVGNILASENAAQWYPIEAAIKEDTKMQKYMTLLRSGLTATSTEAQTAFNEKNSTFSFNYTVKEFASIPDESVAVTDADLKAYYNEHKTEKRFKQTTEQRDIKFVVFEMNASPEDIQTLRVEMSEMMPAFAADSNDTAFVLENTDQRLNEYLAYKTADEINPQIKDAVLASEVGQVFGPYQQGDYLLISKLTGTKASPDSAQARHIFIQANPQDTASMADANALLDSLKSVIEKKKNFAALAEEFSDDLGTAANGGDFGDWLTSSRQDIPQAVVTNVLDGKKGDLTIVTSQAGVHLVEITNQTTAVNRYLLATIDNRIEPSKATANEVYNSASKFALEHKTRASFDAANEDNMIQVAQNVIPGAKMLGRVTDAEEIVRWAFSAEAGDISEPKETENSIVVAMVDLIKAKGILPFEAVKEIIRPAVINEKKTAMIKSDLGQFTSLDEAAGKLGAPVKSINNVNFDANVLPDGLGRELKVLGAAAAMSENEVSGVIEGNRGVFVINLMGKTPAAGEADLVSEKRQMSNTLSGRVNQSAYEALKTAADIEDNRALFY
ncbi:MAG: SurA N-terminal domain-containing protein [Salibacteraceae bacterium]|jgi:peptidyl-prolyl cis-trans isomerase D|nr:SurA N-terminal domain-containing protein [Salibacteraceae bacterium]MDP4687458.1 SurA N-terminal domain-containing protein [Salibacteraceae bacterium]MDP4764234.1 SurA N-terminal domain-containing protein [Salibacteraceae bacterium]MDP4966065.1 SurA N-terminal domain-containing protein [Salibacteraceae bacterium]